jgi:hypothetical protein
LTEKTIPPARRRKKKKPIIREGAWLKVNEGWLTGRGAPLDVQGVRYWGADVVLSLVCAATFSTPQKNAIFEEAEKAGAVKEYRQFSVDPISGGEPVLELKQRAATNGRGDLFVVANGRVLAASGAVPHENDVPGNARRHDRAKKGPGHVPNRGRHFWRRSF